MASMEERMSYLEATVAKQNEAHATLRSDLARFEARMDARFNSIDARFNSIDERFSSIDGRFSSNDDRFTRIETRIDALDDKVSRQFIWLVGMQMTTLIAVVGALLARP